MANFNISPSMMLPIPIPGVDPGPQWATDLNACLTLIDGHDHSNGRGVQINPTGININSDLTFNNNNGIAFRSARFQAQPSLISLGTDLNAIFVNGVDLYYNDGNGNHVRLTQSGAVSGTPGSIANLVAPASASYVIGNQTFVFQSAVNTPANIDAGSFIFRNITAGSNGITVSAPPALGASYNIILPTAPPASLAPVYMANNGQLSTGSTGPVISASCGTFANNTNVETDVTNLTLSITTKGRPVWVAIISDGSNNPSNMSLTNSAGATSVQSTVNIYRGVTKISSTICFLECAPDAGVLNFDMVCNIFTIDTPTAGTYTYKVTLTSGAANNSSGMNRLKLIAYEM